MAARHDDDDDNDDEKWVGILDFITPICPKPIRACVIKLSAQ
jgi:hypothetical protein